MKKLTFAFSACLLANLCYAVPLKFNITTDHTNALYKCGEEATFVVTATDTNGVKVTAGDVSYKIDNFGSKELSHGKLDLAKENPFTLKGKLAEPGFLRLTLSAKDTQQKVWGVGYEPTKIKQGVAKPKDFEDYWRAEVRRLAKEVPLDAKQTLVPEKSKGAFNYYRVSFATFNGKRVYGFMTVPKDASTSKRYPVRLNVPGAGPWLTGIGGAADAICCTMIVHPFDPPATQDELKARYDQQDKELIAKYGVRRYCQAGIHVNREEYFYHDILLGINRAFDYVCEQAGADFNRVSYNGTSQGGGFGFYMCALNRYIRRGCIFVPAITDLQGNEKGRQSGWPQIIENQAEQNRAAAKKWAPYFDAANFASMIQIPVRVVVGFADTTCAPCAVYAGFNVIPAKDKQIYHGIGMGHGVFPNFYGTLGKWERDWKNYDETNPRYVSLGRIKEALAAMPKGHPRLFLPCPIAFAELRANLASNTPKAEWKLLSERIIKRADAYLNDPCTDLRPEGFRIFNQAKVSAMLGCLSTAYQLTLDKKYAARAEKEMLYVCDWKTWNPAHYLDTSEILLGFGIAYDWCFDALSPATRAKLRKTMVERAFMAVDEKPQHRWWATGNNNWTQVCYNGIMVAALAIAEDEPAWAERWMFESIRNLPRALDPYAPNGSYPEGPSYWTYGTGRFVYHLALLDALFGTTFGLYEMPGISRTAEYFNLMFGPTGKSYNYADSGNGGQSFQISLLWLAKKAGRMDVCEFETKQICAALNDPKKSFNIPQIPALLFFWVDYPLVPVVRNMPLTYYSEGETPVALFRSSWLSDAAYLCTKGGRASYNHGHEDIGAFIYDCDGVRWAVDLGSQSYYSIERLGMNLWSNVQGSDRYKVFRISAASHNIVTIDGKGLTVAGEATLKPTADGCGAIVDVTPCYSTQAKKAVRTLHLDKKTRVATIEDNFDGLARGAKVRWAMVTHAEKITPVEGGILLEEKGKKCFVKPQNRNNVQWQIDDLTTPPNSWDVPNEGYHMVSFTVETPASGSYHSIVTMGPTK